MKGPFQIVSLFMVPGPGKNGQINWTDVLKKALVAVRAGRELLLRYYGDLKKVESKAQAGLVSEADRESEKLIKAHLARIAPDWEFLGEEESFFHGDAKLQRGSNPRWILDPLDGTTNYVHQFPVFCISLALEVDGDLRIAVIDAPLLGETYTAVRGEGAFLNGRPIHVSQTKNLSEALLATGFFAENKPALEDQLRVFTRLVGETRGIRRAGAAAYDLCMVAKGTFDGFWEPNLKPWDVAAGQLLVEEAGGQVVNRSGARHSPYDDYCIATNRNLSSLVLNVIQSKS